MENLHLLLCISLLVCGLFVIFSLSPVESMIALILMFCISGVILFIFNSEFLGVTFVIIYVGAIAVLFLFIIMMLNVKRKVFSFKVEKHFVILFFSIIVILVSIYYGNESAILAFLQKVTVFKYSIDERYLSKELNEVMVDSLSNINVLGQGLFNYYSVSFLLAGLVLLVALVGAVVLTLNFSTNKKNQISFRQLSRTDSFLSHLKK
jgi:NADH-quinone oxidoreductase subunit J